MSGVPEVIPPPEPIEPAPIQENPAVTGASGTVPTTVENWGALAERAPELAKAIEKGIFMRFSGYQKRSQERIKKILREAERQQK